MTYLGDRSYALCISQFVVIVLARELVVPVGVQSTWQAWAWLVLVLFPVVLLVAGGLHAGVERPLYRRFARSGR